MKFIYGKQHWNTIEQAQEHCFLMGNGLGGYCAQSIAGSCNRNDHALLMAALEAPTVRYNLISKLDETMVIGEQVYELSTQEYANHLLNKTGFRYLNAFSFDAYPTWTYQAAGVEVEKSIVMEYGENAVGVRYLIRNDMQEDLTFYCAPQMQFAEKGGQLQDHQQYEVTKDFIRSNGITLYYKSNGTLGRYEEDVISYNYYSYDARDGRGSMARTFSNHNLMFQVAKETEAVCYVIYSTKKIPYTMEELFVQAEQRQENLIRQAGLANEVAKQLVCSADQFIVRRDSTKGQTIIAGYPFFTDWGRDTMIAMLGCCIATKRYEDAKSIFRSFMKYCRRGIMPNMFPESGQEPFYNTVDASLLFIGAVYEYYEASNDFAFVKECYPVMREIIEWYQNGTDYHIRMDSDGLIQAGADLEQVTWMDIRYHDILPTPRHGKPVEINAYWYNDLRIMELFAQEAGSREEAQKYKELAEWVQLNFRKKFWNPKTGCLKDVLSGGAADDQIRCNQIWAVSQAFSPLEQEQAKAVVRKVFELLYTPYGLRTLNQEDPQYHGQCCGNQYERDMAYHQGTVWTFPLGAYYLAYLKVHDYSETAVDRVKRQLCAMHACLREGCVAQIAEIYDGDNPSLSRGCFAQAWSVGEILRVYEKLECTGKGKTSWN